ncbi:hypothetical protein [Saccharothrix luteola]|uniref:hypothetical protein n=1 Tax=Saccharothrix luteola TaxID=2893018 RepID=UPI001E5DA928|nr:hypothetical protein [Saccharothrix luteola]MCC8246966.1 hypothetical protein [Saccharothrix luteola]
MTPVLPERVRFGSRHRAVLDLLTDLGRPVSCAELRARKPAADGEVDVSVCVAEFVRRGLVALDSTVRPAVAVITARGLAALAGGEIPETRPELVHRYQAVASVIDDAGAVLKRWAAADDGIGSGGTVQTAAVLARLDAALAGLVDVRARVSFTDEDRVMRPALRLVHR